VKIPPGWTDQAGHKEYFESANPLRYMIWGDMNVWQFRNPADAGKAVKVTPGYFICQPPRGILGYGQGSVTEKGAVWLEVTYTRCLKHSAGGPIEEPKVIK
jgi:hypothetical protein